MAANQGSWIRCFQLFSQLRQLLESLSAFQSYFLAFDEDDQFVGVLKRQRFGAVSFCGNSWTNFACRFFFNRRCESPGDDQFFCGPLIIYLADGSGDCIVGYCFRCATRQAQNAVYCRQGFLFNRSRRWSGFHGWGGMSFLQGRRDGRWLGRSDRRRCRRLWPGRLRGSRRG